MSSTQPSPAPTGGWRQTLYRVIFEADTFAGKAFDVVLILAILLSVLVVSLETVGPIDREYHRWLAAAEWLFTLCFTAEYLLRLAVVRSPRHYALSFFGVVDLLAILPAYLALLLPGSQSLMVIRTFRLLRVFRVFKLGHFLSEAATLRHAVWEARAKVVVFLATVLVVVTVMATAMYLVESQEPDSQFTSIPQAMYWAIVTMTTVGYGDVVPRTVLGKMLSALLILIGYSLIVVPTGFVSAQLISAKERSGTTTRTCPHCLAEGHDGDARYCKYCGAKLATG